MKRFTLSKTLVAVLFLLACHSNKKSIAAATPVIAEHKTILDTPKVEKNIPPKMEVYQGADPLVCDLIHTRLDVSFDWTYSRLNGKAEITLKPHFYPTPVCYLNARGMDIKSVKLLEDIGKETIVKGKKTKTESWKESVAQYKYENDSIKIDLGRMFTRDEQFKVQIEYVAKPDELEEGGSNAIMSDKGLYFVNPKSLNPYKMPQIWTQGETQSNSVWFPTIDSPHQKMTQDIYMTVMERFTTLSNGLMVDSKKNNDGTRTDHWKMDLPHAPYLVMMAVGEFKKVVDEPWNGKEVSYYVEAQYEPYAKDIFGNTKEMIEFYSQRLGVPYAWPKYAQIAVRDYVSGAMENTSATLHGDFAVYSTSREIVDGNKGEDIIAHELFHQWFGDLVTCESWSNLPLNESFATYGEYLWEEHKFGVDAADYHHMSSRAGYMAQKKQVNLIRFNYHNREDMFDGFSYNKGGQVLHMLRKLVGDDAFFASLKNYLETRKFKTAEIHDLRLAFEEVTGQDMNWFFNQWFLSKGHPELEISYVFNEGAKQVELTVEQKQDFKETPLYKLPMAVDVYTSNKPERFLIEIKEAKQTFKFPATGKPQLVNFDAERQLLAEITYTKSTDEYIFQYQHAPKFVDRYEALKELKKEIKNDKVYALIKQAAEKDPFDRMRSMAISYLDAVASDKKDELKPLMISIYKNDKSTKVQARALEFLNTKCADASELESINAEAILKESCAIAGEALEYYTKKDQKIGMAKAKDFEKDMSKSLLIKVAGVYAKYGADENIAFFHMNMKNFSGFELISFLSNYIKLAKLCNTSDAALEAVYDFEVVAAEGGKFTKPGAVKGLKDLNTVWTKKENEMKAKIDETTKANGDIASLEKELKTITETNDIIKKILEKVK